MENGCSCDGQPDELPGHHCWRTPQKHWPQFQLTGFERSLIGVPLSGVASSARQDTIPVSPGINHNMNAGISLETRRLQTQQTGVFRHISYHIIYQVPGASYTRYHIIYHAYTFSMGINQLFIIAYAPLLCHLLKPYVDTLHLPHPNNFESLLSAVTNWNQPVWRKKEKKWNKKYQYKKTIRLHEQAKRLDVWSRLPTAAAVVVSDVLW